jgi:putative addiction module component (TIGR02574 family)
MTDAPKKPLEAATSLPEEERLELASELIASVDGPPDSNWDSTWVAELDRRVEAARERGELASEWAEVRARLLSRLGG